MKDSRQVKGFTLIELLAAISIMGLAISLLASSIWQKAEQSARLEKMMFIQQVTLSSPPRIDLEMENGLTQGEWNNGDALVTWQAQAINQSVTEGKMNYADGIIEGAGISIKLWRVELVVSFQDAVRSYEFDTITKGNERALQN